MGTKLYVGNLSFNTTENELQELFAGAGTVQEVTLMQDKFTGKSRGFAFVTMGTEQEAQNAITQFNGKSVEGRSLTVNEARPREPRKQADRAPIPSDSPIHHLLDVCPTFSGNGCHRRSL